MLSSPVIVACPVVLLSVVPLPSENDFDVFSVLIEIPLAGTKESDIVEENEPVGL